MPPKGAALRAPPVDRARVAACTSGVVDPAYGEAIEQAEAERRLARRRAAGEPARGAPRPRPRGQGARRPGARAGDGRGRGLRDLAEGAPGATTSRAVPPGPRADRLAQAAAGRRDRARRRALRRAARRLRARHAPRAARAAAARAARRRSCRSSPRSPTSRGPTCRSSRATFPAQMQIEFTERVIRDLGFDMQAGRQDELGAPVHLGRRPVRRAADDARRRGRSARLADGHDPRDRPRAVRAGHRRRPDRAHASPGMAPSLGLHESQSRLWENQVGRSRAFWEHYYPAYRERVPRRARRRRRSSSGCARSTSCSPR